MTGDCTDGWTRNILLSSSPRSYTKFNVHRSWCPEEVRVCRWCEDWGCSGDHRNGLWESNYCEEWCGVAWRCLFWGVVTWLKLLLFIWTIVYKHITFSVSFWLNALTSALTCTSVLRRITTLIVLLISLTPVSAKMTCNSTTFSVVLYSWLPFRLRICPSAFTCLLHWWFCEWSFTGHRLIFHQDAHPWHHCAMEQPIN